MAKVITMGEIMLRLSAPGGDVAALRKYNVNCDFDTGFLSFKKIQHPHRRSCRRWGCF